MNTEIKSLICEAPQGQDYLCSIIYPHDHAICLTKEVDVLKSIITLFTTQLTSFKHCSSKEKEFRLLPNVSLSNIIIEHLIQPCKGILYHHYPHLDKINNGES